MTAYARTYQNVRSVFELLPLSASRAIPFAALVGIGLLSSLALTLNGFQSPSDSSRSSTPTGSGALAGAVALAGDGTSQHMREMHIANNGLALVRGAEVVSVSGSSIRTRIRWGSGDFVWVIETSSKTAFFLKNGEKGALADIRAGDIITASGMVASNNSDTVMSATSVRK